MSRTAEGADTRQRGRGPVGGRELATALMLALAAFVLGAPAAGQGWVDLFEEMDPARVAAWVGTVRCGPSGVIALDLVSPDPRARFADVRRPSGRAVTLPVADTLRGVGVEHIVCHIDGAADILLEHDGRYAVLRAHVDNESGALLLAHLRHPDGGIVVLLGGQMMTVDGAQAALRARADSLRTARDESIQQLARDLRRRYGWPPPMAEAVARRQVVVGMNSDMVRASWGSPDRINTTVTAAGTREQWVYGLDYVYIENGLVNSIHTSR